MADFDLSGKYVRQFTGNGEGVKQTLCRDGSKDRHLKSVLWSSIDEEELTGVAKAGPGAWEERRLRDAIKQAALSCSPQLRAQIASRQINWRESVCR